MLPDYDPSHFGETTAVWEDIGFGLEGWVTYEAQGRSGAIEGGDLNFLVWVRIGKPSDMMASYGTFGAGAKGGGATASPEYKGYKILQSIDNFFGKDKVQKTFVNPAMKAGLGQDSGNGADMTTHLQAKGLSVTSAGSVGAILTALENTKVDVLTIGAHGSPGVINMKGGIPVFDDPFGFNSVSASDDFWKNVKANLNSGATILLLGCEFGGDEYGVESMARIAALTGATIVAPTGKYATLIGADGQMSGTANIIKTSTTPAGVPGYIVVPPPKS